MTLNLQGVVTDKAFHIYISQVQGGRNEHNRLGVEEIIALYKVKQGLFAEIKPSTIERLERENLISKSTGSSNRYALEDPYSTLAEREQRIGSRYLAAEVGQFLMTIQGKTLKIGELETALTGVLNRNQIKYLVTKLFEDNIISNIGAGRGTRYKLKAPFDALRGDSLMNEVVSSLMARHTE